MGFIVCVLLTFERIYLSKCTVHYLNVNDGGNDDNDNNGAILFQDGVLMIRLNACGGSFHWRRRYYPQMYKIYNNNYVTLRYVTFMSNTTQRS